MRLHELQKLLEATPQGTPLLLTLPADDLKEALSDLENVAFPTQETIAPVADLSVAEIAEALDKNPATIRGMMPAVAGSYKLAGEWRVSREDWRTHLASLAEQEAEKRAPRRLPGAPLRHENFRWKEPPAKG